MKYDILLERLFPDGMQINIDRGLLKGVGVVGDYEVCLAGTVGTVSLGVEELLGLGRILIEAHEDHPEKPVLMLINNAGHRIGIREELLGLPECIAHLAGIQYYMCDAGQKLLSLIYGNSVGGGSIAFGIAGPGRVYALSDADTSVMPLSAISRVTGIAENILEEVSKREPVFAPGCDNFLQMGGIHGIVSSDGSLAEWLHDAIADYDSSDNRAELGLERCGRRLAGKIIQQIIEL